ncbi:MAG: hypothetical protein KAS72_02440 [Phycisphaerales bacterium]|nr:hypothetical protein [Phycisphaerales bacterium]
MYCRACGYALWSISPGRCPECGEPFAPTQFSFRPGVVKFLCPHCKQAYAGTDPFGLPAPSHFMCARCGKPVSADCMIALPGDGIPEEATIARDALWPDRKRIGRRRAFFTTVACAMVQPERFEGDRLRRGDVGEAIGFASLVSLGAIVPNALLLFLAEAMMSGLSAWLALRLVGVCVGFAIAYPVIVVSVWAIVTHLLLKVIGRPTEGFSATYRAMLYGQGALLVAAIPVMGWVLAATWVLAASTFAVSAAQRVGAARAAPAVLALPGLLIAGIVVVFVLSVM